LLNPTTSYSKKRDWTHLLISCMVFKITHVLPLVSR
jgi:hypothetical protein